MVVWQFDLESNVNLASALQTAARRYCIERFAFWADRYMEIVRSGRDRHGCDYTPEALAVFPRYNVLNAIRIEIERLDSDILCDLDDTREMLILAGSVAEDDFTRRSICEIDANVMAEERDSFCQFVCGNSNADLLCVEQLPYQRVLTRPESEQLWGDLCDRWQMKKKNYWFPLDVHPRAELMAFDASAFQEHCPPLVLRNALTARGVSRLWELREYGPEYAQAVALFDPHYNGAEGYWTSREMDWIVYASHEDSITVGGWLLEDIKSAWSDWAKYVWNRDDACRANPT